MTFACVPLWQLIVYSHFGILYGLLSAASSPLQRVSPFAWSLPSLIAGYGTSHSMWAWPADAGWWLTQMFIACICFRCFWLGPPRDKYCFFAVHCSSRIKVTNGGAIACTTDAHLYGWVSSCNRTTNVKQKSPIPEMLDHVLLSH